MKMQESEFRRHCNEFDGYCTECDDVTVLGGVESDAEGRKCDECECDTVMGIEQAQLMELIEVEEDK